MLLHYQWEFYYTNGDKWITISVSYYTIGDNLITLSSVITLSVIITLSVVTVGRNLYQFSVQSVVRQWLQQQPASFFASDIQKLVKR